MPPARTQALLELLSAPLAALEGLDLSDSDAARAELERRYPHDGDEAQTLHAALAEAVAQGVICDRGNDAIRYSRLSKACDETRDHSVDFVWMTGPGINHRHPRGEVNLCFAVDGEPRFDGAPAGWIVFAPDSAHVPTVSGGRMLIVYFLPGGEVEWINAGKA
ncbi:MAG: DUF4863 domain-containing protein [Planctomycetota bacterium]|nr:MAG: DUF4863 domain-containing protein [Planctomycetota bacterium]